VGCERITYSLVLPVTSLIWKINENFLCMKYLYIMTSKPSLCWQGSERRLTKHHYVDQHTCGTNSAMHVHHHNPHNL
jgi:hypothetical protein